MDQKEMKAWIGDAVNDADLRPEEIPAIDLYLDQIVSLASGKLQEGSPRFYDRVLTKTMVNNYSKDGLLSPISGKKYSKEHFLQMLVVYSLKNTLSIGEIKRILKNIYKLPDYDADALSRAYTRFLDTKEYMREHAWSFIESFLQGAGLDAQNEQDFFVMLMGLSAMSSYLKNAAQALLEAHYPDPDAEKVKEERERREELKRAKEEAREEKKKAAADKAEKKKTAAATEAIAEKPREGTDEHDSAE